MRMANQETRCMWSAVHVFVLMIMPCCAFNLDPKFSVIKKMSPDSYFGYSVTQHQIVDESNGALRENLLLVGAPREKKVMAAGTRGGVIYKCNALSTREDDCQPLTDYPFSEPPADKEVLADQWLGVTLRSYGRGQKILTCAHRYIRENAALGICYVFLQNLEYMTTWIPCWGKPHSNFLEDFGLCQAGLSATLGPRDSMVMGAPGSIYWRGVVFLANVSGSLGTDSGPYNSPIPVSPNEEGFKTAQPPPTDKYSYLGYAVELGKFDNSGHLYVASGAPRSKDKGEVVFFQKQGRNVLRYEPVGMLLGTKDFSGFGSTLLAVDLNNDGFDELIVGAPYFYEKGVGGAIYIFNGGIRMIDNTSDAMIIKSRSMSDAECEVLGCEHARFGMSLVKLGDINIDGYQDFAVGAPYEGTGAVYVYHGSKDGMSDMYAQRITASDMPGGENIQSFGYSLAGGLDLDSNGYPDLLVGSYESATVSLLRTRAIIRLFSEISVTPNMTDLAADPYCSVDGSANRCVSLEICLSFTAEPKGRFTSRPTIQYHVEAERTRSVARLEMVKSQDALKKTVSGTVTLYKQDSGSNRCIQELAYLKSGFTDKLNPMELSVTFSHALPPYTRPSPGASLPDINEYPILSTEGANIGSMANTVSTFVDFVKDCGEDNKCLSNLQFEAEVRINKKGDNYVFKDGEFSQGDIKFTITNLGEAAYLTQVYVQKPPQLDYYDVSGSGQDGDVRCLPAEDDNTMITCNEIGNPLKQGASVTFILSLNNKIAPSDYVWNITTWVNTSSTEQTPQNDKYVFPFVVIRDVDTVLSVNVRPDDQILCSGEPRGVSAMETEKDIGPAVNHSYIITNSGSSNVSLSSLTIRWPFEVAGEGSQGKYLLYLMEEPIVEKGEARCVVEPNTINPAKISLVRPETIPVEVDGIKPLGDDLDRQKRETTGESRVRRAQSGVVTLSCEQNTARCRNITCSIINLQGRQAHVKITLRARLWESTLLQDYRKAGDVQIISSGQLKIDPRLQIKQDESNDKAEAVTYAVPDFKDAGEEELQWWWILLAVLGGILLLILIIFCLYKVGFFKRKRPEEMQTYQAEKKRQKMLDDFEDEET